MKLSHPLRAPAATEEASETQPDSLKGWMSGLGNIEGEIEPIQKSATETKKPEAKPDGKTAEDKSATGTDAGTVDKAGAGGAGAVGEGKAGGEGKTAEAVAAKADDKPAAEAEDKWPRTSKDWDSFKAKRRENEEKLKSEIAARDTKVKELETRLQELDERGAKLNEPPPEIKAQIERLTKENEEMSLQLQVLEVTAHPKFKAYFENKTNAQINLAKRIVGTELAEQMEQVLKMPDIPELAEIKQARVEEIISELSPIQQSRIGSVLNALTEIGEERAAEIARANEHKTTITGQQTEQQKQKQEAAIKARDDAFSSMTRAVQDTKNGMPIFQLREGNDEWNAAVGKRLDTAKRYFMGAKDITPQEIARASFMAAALPDMLAAYQADMKAKDEEIGKLGEQVKKLTAAQPGKGESADTAGETNGRVQIKPQMTPGEATAAWMKATRME